MSKSKSKDSPSIPRVITVATSILSVLIAFFGQLSQIPFVAGVGIAVTMTILTVLYFVWLWRNRPRRLGFWVPRAVRRNDLLIMGFIGMVGFLAVGFGGVLPLPFAGPGFGAFLVLSLNEVRERRHGTPSPGNQPKKPEPAPPEPRIERGKNYDTIHFVNDAPIIEPKKIMDYGVSLEKGDYLTIEANADEWIAVDLYTLTQIIHMRETGKQAHAEAGKAGKNITVNYEAKRKGDWMVWVTNLHSRRQQVGVIITAERYA